MKPLYPLMAVLVIASVGAVPLRTHAADGSQNAPAVKADPRNELTKLLTDSSGNRVDAGKRVQEFLLNPPTAAQSFFNADVQDADKTAFGVVAQAWGEKNAAPADVAALYFIIGPGANGPAWTVGSKNFASLGKHAQWEAQLRGALATKGWIGKIHQVEGAKATEGFLNEAVIEARAIFSHPETRAEIDASIGRNDDPPPVPAPGLSAGTRIDALSRGYTLEDLYKTGAKWGDVSGPKDANSRTISLKIYSKRMPDGSIVNEIGVFDITSNSDIFGRRFPVGGPDQSFVLDDRSPGHKKYELKFETGTDGERKIIFRRPDGDAEHSLTTSVSELYMERANQAGAPPASIVKVGNEEFYVVPQGGARGAVAMFPKALIDDRANVKDPRSLEPSLFAEVGKRASDGRTVPISSKPMLGKVGDTDYHLEFNKALGLWEVKEGAGDPPPAAPTTPGNGDNNGGNTGGGNTGGGNTGGGNTPGQGNGLSLDELKRLLGAEYTENADDIKDLRTDLKGKYTIVRGIGGPVVLTPVTRLSQNQQWDFGRVGVRRARYLDRYVVLDFEKAVQYQDLLDGTSISFKIVGYVDTVEKNASQFEDLVTFMDAMKNYMGVTGTDTGLFTAVPARVKAHAGSGQYRLAAGSYINEAGKKELSVNLQTGGRSNKIWPKDEWTPGAPDATQAPYTALNGAANAMDGVSSVDTALPSEIPLGAAEESRVAKLMPGKKDDIALYVVDTDPKKYYVMFRFNAMDQPDASKPAAQTLFRSKHLEVFGANNPLPANYDMQGLTVGESQRPTPVVHDRVVSAQRFVPGTTKAKGVLAVYQRKVLEGPNQQNVKANCVGPLIWWGLSSRAEAWDACDRDKM